MKRKWTEMLSWTSLRHVIYIPIVFLKIQNGFSFLLNWIGLKSEPKIYQFRNGIKIKVNDMTDTATVVVVFLKKEYGNIPDHSTVIDIGSNIGAFSIFAVGTSKRTKVFAYEPMGNSFDLLRQNIKINQFENRVFPFQLGLAAKKGKRKLFIAANSPYHSIYHKNKTFIEIDCITLKDIFDDNGIDSCDVLKVDCEGAEFEILHTAPKEILAKIKEIRLEYHDQPIEGYNIKSLIHKMKKCGFELTFFGADRGYPTGIAWFKNSASSPKAEFHSPRFHKSPHSSRPE